MSDDEALWPPRPQHVVPNDWQSRALKYEQALREVLRLTEIGQHCYACHGIARAALDKPEEGKS